MIRGADLPYANQASAPRQADPHIEIPNADERWLSVPSEAPGVK